MVCCCLLCHCLPSVKVRILVGACGFPTHTYSSSPVLEFLAGIFFVALCCSCLGFILRIWLDSLVQPIFAGLFSVRLSRRRSGASPPSFVGGGPAPRPSLFSSKFRTSQHSSRVVPHDFGCPNMYISAFGFLSSRVFWVCFGLDQLIKTAN